MIVRDRHGIIVQHDPADPKYADGGDSASRMGIWNLCIPQENYPLSPFVNAWKKLVRHPYQSEWDVPEKTSRDQLVCFLSGCHVSSAKILRRAYWFRINRDILMPDVQLHLSLCANHWTKWLLFVPGTLNLILSILWSCKVKPDHELNQLICQISSHPMKSLFYRLMIKLHPNWEKNLRDYWSGWRDQKDIGEMLIQHVLSKNDIIMA